MPQQRQRIVFCDCLDCVEQPATTDIQSSPSPANEAAARQEPPPKCLMFVLSGVLLPQTSAPNPGTATVLDGCSLPHLNRAAAQGNLCLLSLREEGGAADSCAELEQVFCMYQERQEGTTPVTLADRFKGLVASFSSNSSAAQAVAAAAGIGSSSVLQPPSHTAADGGDDGGGVLDPQLTGAGRGKHGSSAAADGNSGADSSADVVSRALPDPAEAARCILQELGLQQADAGLDLLAVHLDLHTLQQQQQQQQGTGPVAPGSSSSAAAAAAVAVLGWLDKTLRYLNNSSAFKDAVLLTVLATPGSSQQAAPILLLAAAGGVQLSATAAVGGPPLQEQQQQMRRVLRPPQSFEQLAGKPLAVSRQRAVLCLRRLPSVIRRDSCSRFSLADCCSSSGTLALLADRLLPEVAYKLGRAPKYGA